MRMLILPLLVILAMACAPEPAEPTPAPTLAPTPAPTESRAWPTETETTFLDGCTGVTSLAICMCMLGVAEERWTIDDFATLDMAGAEYQGVRVEAALRCTPFPTP